METEDAIRSRSSAEGFDPERGLDAEELRELVALACRAPSTYNLQGWRFVLVTEPEARARLGELAGGDDRWTAAPAAVIVLGDLRSHEELGQALAPSVERGDLEAGVVRDWVADAQQAFSDPRRARDEAVRASSMAAMALMLGATARGLASWSTSRFDAEGLREAFGVPNRFLPTLLLALGHSAPGQPQRQKVRRGLGDVLLQGDGSELPT